MSIFIFVLGFEIICCLLIWASGALRRADLANAYRLYCVFVLDHNGDDMPRSGLRPQPRYLGLYAVAF